MTHWIIYDIKIIYYTITIEYRFMDHNNIILFIRVVIVPKYICEINIDLVLTPKYVLLRTREIALRRFYIIY